MTTKGHCESSLGS